MVSIGGIGYIWKGVEIRDQGDLALVDDSNRNEANRDTGNHVEDRIGRKKMNKGVEETLRSKTWRLSFFSYLVGRR